MEASALPLLSGPRGGEGWRFRAGVRWCPSFSSVVLSAWFVRSLPRRSWLCGASRVESWPSRCVKTRLRDVDISGTPGVTFLGSAQGLHRLHLHLLLLQALPPELCDVIRELGYPCSVCLVRMGRERCLHFGKGATSLRILLS